MSTYFDAIVIGAGAAGLFCSGIAGQRGLRVLLIDHAEKVAEKIRISGGGRCNFTNREVLPQHFLSSNPHFCRSALARYTPPHFATLLKANRIGWHEKHKGQLFCDETAQDIIDLLLRECATGGVTHWYPCKVGEIRQTAQGFEVDTARGTVQSAQVVVATGGLSIPKIGATDFGYQLARQFGHRIINTRPALVPLTFDTTQWAPFAALAGLSLPVEIRTRHAKTQAQFSEDLLFTHRGLSGPAVLQISSFWQPGTALQINLSPDLALAPHLQQAKSRSKRHLANELGAVLPSRLVNHWLDKNPNAQKTMAEQRDKELQQVAAEIHTWQLLPSATEGYRKAEVTSGGVDTQGVSSQTMQSKLIEGLHFIGEVLDVTGWLGGYNFQWAWSSAWACAQSLRKSKS